jgi:pimeloyl-ACP methyl ester carboxylesterase
MTAPTRTRRWATALTTGALALSTFVMTTGASAHAAAATGSRASETVPAATITWSACGDRLECATVKVPLDYDEPDGTQIDLAVTRYLASKPDQRIGSVLVNPGGPGESGVEMVTENGALLDEWGAGRFDIVGWDPRGTNASTAVKCFRSPADEEQFWQGVQIPTTASASRAYAKKMEQLAQRCRKLSGELLPHLSTADSARDLEALRQGVGDPALTYIGLS